MFGEMKYKAEEEELESIKAIERDSKWLSEHFEEYKQIYEGKIIAVKDQKILSAAANIQELSNKIEEMGEDPRWVYITSIPPKGIVFIL